MPYSKAIATKNAEYVLKAQAHFLFIQKVSIIYL